MNKKIISTLSNNENNCTALSHKNKCTDYLFEANFKSLQVYFNCVLMSSKTNHFKKDMKSVHSSFGCL